MKLENQVCNEYRADRLKELGIVQEALFYHTHSEKWGVMPKKSIDFSGHPSAAFTVAELGIMLPDDLSVPGINYSFYHRHNWKGESVGYTAFGQDPIEQGWYHTEAEARAAMLIYLLENNIITASEVNARLEKEGGV